MSDPEQVFEPPEPPARADVKLLLRNPLPSNRDGIKRLRAKLTSLMAKKFQELNELVPAPGEGRGIFLASDEAKLLKEAEDIIKELGRAQQVIIALDELLGLPGRTEGGSPEVRP